MLILTENQVLEHLTPTVALGANAYAFYLHGREMDQTPTRLALSVSPSDELPSGGVTLIKPSLTSNALGLKIVSVRNDNAKLNKPTVPASIAMVDRVTGEVTAIIAGTNLTAIRTAAGSAVASAIFSVSSANTLSVIGTGLQGREHARAIIAIRPITTVHFFNRNKQNAEQLCAVMEKSYPNIKFHAYEIPQMDADPSSQSIQALRTSHIICTCTGSSSPVLRSSMISPGTHINAVGSYQPHTRECTTDVMARASIIVDDETATKAGDIAIALQENEKVKEQLCGSLGEYIPDYFATYTAGSEIVASSFLPGHKQLPKLSDITFFKSVGVAIQDIVTGAVIAELANAKQFGSVVDMNS